MKLVSGTVLSQILNIATIPVLTRIYEPQAFGILSLFTSITGIIGVFTCMRYEFSIMLPESDQEAANLFATSLGFTTLISLLTLLITFFIDHFWHLNQNFQSLNEYLFLLPIAVFFAGTATALSHWNSRAKNFSRLSIYQIINAVTTILITIILGFFGYANGKTMIASSIIGQGLAVLFVSYFTWLESKQLLLKVRWQEARILAFRYRNFPIYGIWSALLNTVSWKLPVFILAAYFSPIVAGYYALGFRLLKMPMSLIGKSISHVFFQRAADAKINGNLSILVENTFLALIKVGLFPIFLLSLIGKDLYIVCFGNEWAEAGVYTQILSIWAFFWFISGPFSTLYSVLEKQNIQFKWNIFNFITRVLSLGIGVSLQSPRFTLLMFSLTGIFVYSRKTLINLELSGVSIRKSLHILMNDVVRFIPVACIFLTLAYFDIEIYIRLVIAMIFVILNFVFSLDKIKHAIDII
ncbi:oligosaccharide flippase family protein [Acaryochloris sp. IP29b_bin.148]|uniref:lipopolysaccharide biosynthesis protein n=1 Tax=Acaryochloris sp. IP29b_bin.148 TaxID=2969218 RepID=UPI002631FCD9|nr:oligosaccharide flippase family protein [Acaryochloris sp. IP29b_bin.148]